MSLSPQQFLIKKSKAKTMKTQNKETVPNER